MRQDLTFFIAVVYNNTEKVRETQNTIFLQWLKTWSKTSVNDITAQFRLVLHFVWSFWNRNLNFTCLNTNYTTKNIQIQIAFANVYQNIKKILNMKNPRSDI